ncbi:polysaccharide deacetylase family protein [Xylophilus sp. GOD-11R]|uniref:polysaccharide deacetylase family protein n=1 Tax=Xylophilus sp. GOD-11R TaxID=3089814 RepID=UPI00298BE782|nr:polysaccharide deacetylase family protein [Xylophilus sp. GOD-11R]WPB56110.1 polysaccharide deacetylase family protein [Xylophilus sp. GOD-11R]
MNLAQRASRFLSRYTDRRLLPLRGEVGVVSFSFDDAPMSACVAGAAALERHGVRGTFYVAGGLTDGVEEGLACHSEAALRRLLADGHQLGCHSFSHVHVNRIDAARRREEFERSAAFLAGLGVARETLDFAYPFGGVNVGAKHDCALRFRSSRATGGGTHVGVADLNALRTHRLYRAEPDGVSYADRLAVAASQRGWLVVNTHEVQDDAGPFGCTPGALSQAVAQALEAGCRVMTVGAALDHWTARAG